MTTMTDLVTMIDLDMTISDNLVTIMTVLDWMMMMIWDLDLMTMIDDHDMTMIGHDRTMSLMIQ